MSDLGAVLVKNTLNSIMHDELKTVKYALIFYPIFLQSKV